MIENFYLLLLLETKKSALTSNLIELRESDDVMLPFIFQVKASLSFCPSISMSRRIGTRTSDWVAFSWITAGSWSSKLSKTSTQGQNFMMHCTQHQHDYQQFVSWHLISGRVYFTHWRAPCVWVSKWVILNILQVPAAHHSGKVLFLSRPSRLRLMVVEQGTASRWWELLGSVGTHWLFLFAFCSLKTNTDIWIWKWNKNAFYSTFSYHNRRKQ